jgi:4'-phosphopantetheinyl transferase
MFLAHPIENQVDIWCARFPDEWDSELLQSYLDLLTAKEKERFNRFVFEQDRRQFLLTRALERDVLSRYLGVEPAELVLTRNEYGKPALAEPVNCPIAFNLSHTKGLSVCAVAAGQIIGVDVESLQRTNVHQDIAKRFFANSEAGFLERLNDAPKQIEFLKLWTLKEAFIKARGLGLSIPLKSFEISMFPDRPPSVFFSDVHHGNMADWQFLQIRLGRSFHIGVALKGPKPKGRAVKISAIIPLSEASASVSLEPNRLNEWEIDRLEVFPSIEKRPAHTLKRLQKDEAALVRLDRWS